MSGHRYVRPPIGVIHERVVGVPATYGGEKIPVAYVRGRRGGRRYYGQIRGNVVDIRQSSAKKPENKIFTKDKMGTKIYMTQKKKKKTKQRGIVKRFIPATIAPKRKLVRVKASQYGTIECPAGAIGKTPVNMFNICDPFSASSNQQPLGYDQWQTLYNSAVVLGVKLVARIHNRSTVAVITGITACNEGQGTTTLTDYEHYQEIKGTKSRLLSPDVDHTTMFMKVNTKKHVGVRKIMDEDEWHCLDLANETAPVRTAYFHLWAQPMDQATALTNASTNSVQVNYTVEYIILLHDQIIPSTRPTHA